MMNREILFLCLFLFSQLVVAAEDDVDLGDSKQKILEIKGAPTSEVEVENHNGSFLNLYYRNTDTTYVIDVEKNVVCEIGSGDTPSACYPCSGENGEDLCI